MNRYIDATILKPDARHEDYKALCKDARQYEFPAVCVPPYMVQDCAAWLHDSTVKTATVIGFPAGYQSIPTKMYELKDAIDRGAQEIDYVIHRGHLANNDFENIEEETLAWVDICRQSGVASKWIIESSELTRDQIVRLLELANKFQPDYVKTSTGVYGKARLEDVELFRKELHLSIKIKAAGGIASKDYAQSLIDAGADRLGVSQYINLVS